MLHTNVADMSYATEKFCEDQHHSDHSSVLRDGHTVSTDPTSALDTHHLIARMVGREVTDIFPTTQHKPENVVFEARGVTVEDPNVAGKLLVDDVSFAVRRGEVLGIAGLVGAGRSDLMMAIFGAHPGRTAGQFFAGGSRITINQPSAELGA